MSAISWIFDDSITLSPLALYGVFVVGTLALRAGRAVTRRLTGRRRPPVAGRYELRAPGGGQVFLTGPTAAQVHAFCRDTGCTVTRYPAEQAP